MSSLWLFVGVTGDCAPDRGAPTTTVDRRRSDGHLQRSVASGGSIGAAGERVGLVEVWWSMGSRWLKLGFETLKFDLHGGRSRRSRLQEIRSIFDLNGMGMEGWKGWKKQPFRSVFQW